MSRKSLIKFTLTVLVIPALLVAITQILFALILKQLALPNTLAVFLTLLLGFGVSIFVLLKILPKLHKKFRTNREELGLLGLPTWTDILLSPLAFVASTILALILTAIFSLLPQFNPQEAQNLGINQLLTPIDRLLGFVGLVIIPPIAEEIIFRGWIYGKLRSRLSLPPAMLLTSLLFAIMHGQLNVGVAVFAMSAVACFLREITGTIYAPILLHMLKNGIAFYLLFFTQFWS